MLGAKPGCWNPVDGCRSACCRGLCCVRTVQRGAACTLCMAQKRGCLGCLSARRCMGGVPCSQLIPAVTCGREARYDCCGSQRAAPSIRSPRTSSSSSPTPSTTTASPRCYGSTRPTAPSWRTGGCAVGHAPNGPGTMYVVCPIHGCCCPSCLIPAPAETFEGTVLLQQELQDSPAAPNAW